MEFSKRLKEELIWKGITQKKLAEMLNIERTNISNWISGRNLPSLEIFYRVCLILEESADYLLGLS